MFPSLFGAMSPSRAESKPVPMFCRVCQMNVYLPFVCSSVSGNLYCATARYVVGASKSDRSYIMLYPPLLIYNLFHAPIDYRLANRDNSFLVATGQIEPSDALQIDSLHVASKHILMFKVPNYGWSKYVRRFLKAADCSDDCYLHAFQVLVPQIDLYCVISRSSAGETL